MFICCDLCQPNVNRKAVVRVLVTVEVIDTGEVRTKHRDLCAAHAGMVSAGLPSGLRGALNAPHNQQLIERPALRLTEGS